MGQTLNDRGLSLGRNYCFPTAAKASDVHVGGIYFLRDLQAKKRADERTRTAYPCSSYECAVRGC